MKTMTRILLNDIQDNVRSSLLAASHYIDSHNAWDLPAFYSGNCGQIVVEPQAVADHAAVAERVVEEIEEMWFCLR